jgi:hypothetical protein
MSISRRSFIIAGSTAAGPLRPAPRTTRTNTALTNAGVVVMPDVPNPALAKPPYPTPPPTTAPVRPIRLEAPAGIAADSAATIAPPMTGVEDDAGADAGEHGEGPAKYKIARGNWGLNYVDVIEAEIPEDQFTLDHAIETIKPLVDAKPESWRRSVRRSLENDKKKRYQPVPDQPDTWRRVAPRTPEVNALF